jgi:hypothetical protein
LVTAGNLELENFRWRIFVYRNLVFTNVFIVKNISKIRNFQISNIIVLIVIFSDYILRPYISMYQPKIAYELQKSGNTFYQTRQISLIFADNVVKMLMFNQITVIVVK